MAEIPERVGILETKMDRVEEFAANSLRFQATAAAFFVRADERAEAERDFHNTRDKENASRDDRRDRKWNLRTGIILAFCAVATLLLGILIYLHGKDAVNSGRLKWPTLSQIYTAHNSQESKNPYIPPSQ